MRPSRAKTTVLLVDDDAGLRLLLGAELEAGGYRVIACSDAESALQRPLQGIDLAVVDYHLPDRSGLELLRRLRNKRGRLPALVITSEHGVRRDPDWPGGADAEGTALLTKPFPRRAFLDSVQALQTAPQ